MTFSYIRFLLVLNLVRSTYSDQGLKYALKMQNNLLHSNAKYWHQYCRMCLYKCLVKHMLRYHVYSYNGGINRKLFNCAELFLHSRLKNVFTSIVQKGDYESGSMKRVSGQIFILNRRVGLTTYKFLFMSDSRIRMNITVHMLYSYVGYLNCTFEIITFQTVFENREVFDYFCFHLSSFNFYPESSILFIKLEVCFTLHL